MRLSGAEDTLHLMISGAGDLSGDQLKVSAATVEISGAGHALVNASQRLDIAVSGVGSVRCVGRPQITRSVCGLGSLERAH